MNEITNLIENIKARWNDQTTYLEYDLIKILSMVDKKLTELDQQVNSKGYEFVKKQQKIIKDLTKRKCELLLENTRLRDALRWHDASLKPDHFGWYVTKDNNGDVWVSKYVEKFGWQCITLVKKWMYIPADTEGDE